MGFGTWGASLLANSRRMPVIVEELPANGTPVNARGPYRIVTRNVTDEVDRFTAREIARRIANDPVASRAYDQIRRTGQELILDFGPPPIPGAVGSAAGEVRIFVRETRGLDEAVATIVHESNHAIRLHRRVSRFFGYNQMDEYRAFRREFLFTNGRRPTFAERRGILAEIRGNPFYNQLPTGNVPPALTWLWEI